MSNNAGRGSRRQRRRRPAGSPASDQSPLDAAPDAGAAGEALVHGFGLESLERLRDRVEQAAQELRQLRETNASLSARIRELQADDAEDRPALTLDKDPELLRRKITGFIDAIDRFLEQEHEEG